MDDGGLMSTMGGIGESSPTRRPAVARWSGGPRVCNYCCGDSHWKDQCPLVKSKLINCHPRAMLASTVRAEKPVLVSAVDSEPFVADAFVSLVVIKLPTLL